MTARFSDPQELFLPRSPVAPARPTTRQGRRKLIRPGAIGLARTPWWVACLFQIKDLREGVFGSAAIGVSARFRGSVANTGLSDSWLVILMIGNS